MEQAKRKSVYEDLKIFIPSCKDSDYIEITEWTNGDGCDIDINEEKKISLSYEELDAINFLTGYIRYYE